MVFDNQNHQALNEFVQYIDEKINPKKIADSDSGMWLVVVHEEIGSFLKPLIDMLRADGHGHSPNLPQMANRPFCARAAQRSVRNM